MPNNETAASPRYIGSLGGDDLHGWQQLLLDCWASTNASPMTYESAREKEARRVEFVNSLIPRFGIDDCRPWDITTAGTVHYTDDPPPSAV